MKYHDASWHYGGDFPQGSPNEFGATHIALFLKWCFCKGWIGDLHKEDAPDEVERLVSGQLSATEFFLMHCDGKLTNEDLSAEGNAFAEKYYGENGLYLTDYATHFGEFMYVAPEAAHNYEQFTAMIDDRLKSGVLEDR